MYYLTAELYSRRIQCKLDLADTDLAENLDLKDTLQKTRVTIFDFQYISPLKNSGKSRISGDRFSRKIELLLYKHEDGFNAAALKTKDCFEDKNGVGVKTPFSAQKIGI